MAWSTCPNCGSKIILDATHGNCPECDHVAGGHCDCDHCSTEADDRTPLESDP